MQNILGFMRKAISDYDMVQNGDKIGVGLSGGKDSTILLMGLAQLKKFIGVNFNIVGLTLDPMFNNQPTDYAPLQQICKKYNIKHIVKKTDIGPIVFDIRKEKHPCSLCARLRRGILHDLAKQEGCNKIALGHNSNDLIETFFMNLFFEGRLGAFLPTTYLSIKGIHVIRPLMFTPENIIQKTINKLNIPIVKSKCPADKASKRQWTKGYISNLSKDVPNVEQKILGAIIRSNFGRGEVKNTL